jgi:hypothetical protein
MTAFEFADWVMSAKARGPKQFPKLHAGTLRVNSCENGVVPLTVTVSPVFPAESVPTLPAQETRVPAEFTSSRTVTASELS